MPSWIRILIGNLNADPDPDPATQINVDPCGSGSETLPALQHHCIRGTVLLALIVLVQTQDYLSSDHRQLICLEWAESEICTFQGGG